MSPRRLRLPRWAWLVGLLVLLAGAGTAAAVVLMADEGNVSNPDVAFTTQAPPPPPPPPRRGDAPFSWPVYGYDRQRSKRLALGNPAALHPPYRERWAIRGSVLLEFPPVLGGRSLYLLKNNGALYAASRRTGVVRWKRKLGELAASSPAVSGDTVVAVMLKRKGAEAGAIVAVDAATGRTKWSRPLPSRAESSPLIDRGRIFFGSENGTIYALRLRDGAVRWTAKAGGAVKGALAMDERRNLYVGDYGGNVLSLRARDGSERWRTGAGGGALGFGGTRFYSTPAVAYGRVFIGGIDGAVYSFGTASGELAWRRETGGYVYSSPAVAEPGGRPTVYAGSYDGNLYALDARSGSVRWSRSAGGRISGGVVVIGDMVWASTLEKTTTAYGTGTGRTLYRTDRGAFNPAISDGRRVYFVGYSSLFALEPRRARR